MVGTVSEVVTSQDDDRGEECPRKKSGFGWEAGLSSFETFSAFPCSPRIRYLFEIGGGAPRNGSNSPHL